MENFKRLTNKKNLYWILLAVSLILIITNPSERDYTAYLGRSGSSVEDVEYSLKSLYCRSYDQNIQRTQCSNLIKISKQNNPNYLEEWLNSKGSSSFTRKNLVLFSSYHLPWSTQLSGDNSTSWGAFAHIGIVGNFVSFLYISLAFVILAVPVPITILIFLYFYKKRRSV